MLKLFKKIPVKLRFAVWVLLGFASMGCFITSTTYYADVHHSNMQFTVAGIILALIVVLIGKAAWAEEKSIESED
jgi:hypothetical protein